MCSRVSWVAAIALVLAGCSGEESAPQERPRATAPPSIDEAPEADVPAVPEAADTVTNPAVADPFEIGDTRVLDGLEVVYESTGELTVRGTDRWSQPIDTQFQDGQYFRDAVPTLSRSVTDEQAAMLRDVAAHIPQSAPAPAMGPAAEGAPAPD